MRLIPPPHDVKVQIRFNCPLTGQELLFAASQIAQPDWTPDIEKYHDPSVECYKVHQQSNRTSDYLYFIPVKEPDLFTMHDLYLWPDEEYQHIEVTNSVKQFDSECIYLSAAELTVAANSYAERLQAHFAEK